MGLDGDRVTVKHVVRVHSGDCVIKVWKIIIKS